MKSELTVTAQVKARLRIISSIADGKVHACYANIKIILNNNGITFYSSNSSQHAQMTCAIKLDDPTTSIEFCVNAERLASVISGCDDNQVVKMKLTDDKLVCRIGRSQATIKVTSKDAKDYPDVLNDNGEVKTVFIDYENLVRTFLRSGYAVGGINETRTILKNVHLETNNKSLYMVSTNGHRLSISSCPVSIGENSEPLEINVSAAFFKLLFSGIDRKFKGEVQLRVGKSTIQVLSDGLLISSSLSADKYPNYKKVIPANFVATTLIDRDVLLQAVQRVTAFAGLGQKGAIELNAENGEMCITGENIVDGSSNDVISLADPTVSFRTKLANNYLIEALEKTEVNENGQVLMKISPCRTVTFLCNQSAVSNSYSIITPRN